MFNAIEKYKLPAQILLGVIGLSFVFAGGYSLSLTGTDYIAKVGDVKISTEDVSDAFRRAQAQGMAADKQTVYQGLLNQAYVQQGAYNLGASVSLDQIKSIIIKDSSFQENGQFDVKKYQQFLQQSGLKEQDLLEIFRKQVALQTMYNLIQAGNIVSDQQASQMLTLLQSPRQMQTMDFSIDRFIPKVVIDGTKLKDFYNKNKTNYFLKQAVKYEYVSLSENELAAKQTVSDAELQEAYAQLPTSASETKPSLESVKSTLVQQIQQRKATKALQEAKDTLTDLAFNNPQSLQPAADKLKLPIHKVDQIWLTSDEAKNMHLPQSLVDALFSAEVLDKNYNSELIDMGANQYWVVRALAVRKEHQGTFEEVKAQVQKDYIAQQSRQLAMDAAQSALDKVKKNETIDGTWTGSQAFTPQQAISLMPAEDFKNWVKAKPVNGKPAYVLLTQGDNPILVKINAVLPATDDMKDALPNMKNILAQGETQQLLFSTLEWLKANIKLKQGAQKLDSDD